jgi:phosphopantetheine--protein transferase-like protein
VGIDVEPITERPASFLATAFTPRERALLDRWTDPSRSEWIARFWSAKVAAAKASGMGLAGRPASAEVVDVYEDTGVVHVRVAPEGLAAGAESVYKNPLRVISARRGQRAWAWTIGKGINP